MTKIRAQVTPIDIMHAEMLFWYEAALDIQEFAEKLKGVPDILDEASETSRIQELSFEARDRAARAAVKLAPYFHSRPKRDSGL